MYLCVQNEISQHSPALQPCRPSSSLLTAFPARFIRHRLLHLSPRSLPSPPPLVPQRPKAGRVPLRRDELSLLLSGCHLTQSVRAQQTRTSNFLTSSGRTVLQLCPPRPCAPTQSRKELALSGEAALTPPGGEGFHGTLISGLYSCHGPSPAVTQRD